MSLVARNHFVPQSYLREWSDLPNKIWTYRTLVSSSKVPLWERKSIVGVACHQHLYTKALAGPESDEIERWLGQEFETPAADALRKARLDASLTSDDWKRIVNFVAAQDVRTPTRLLECLSRWQATLPEIVSASLQESVDAIAEGRARAPFSSALSPQLVESFPVQITKSLEGGASHGTIQAEVVVGRALWLFGIRHLLTSTVNVLREHDWTVLRAPKGFEWITSDNPVLRLNYLNPQQYDLGGGWGSDGTELMMPISPTRLLYAKVGRSPPNKGTVLSRQNAEAIQRFLAENARRLIFSKSANDEVQRWRPRITSRDAVRHEAEQWVRWHDEQSAAERGLKISSLGRKTNAA